MSSIHKTIEQFIKGGREELARVEKEELSYLEKYLPEMMSKDELQKIAAMKKNELNITEKSQAGILMGAIMKELKGKADGKLVKNIVDSMFD